MMAIFASYNDFMTFEDYLDMMSVLSENAPLDLKAEYAFRLYGTSIFLFLYFKHCIVLAPFCGKI